MKIGLYGGSFDPIHHGHVLALTDALEAGDLAQVIVLPAAQAPLRAEATATSAVDRLAMVRLALEHEPRFVVSDFECAKGGTSYSVDTAAHFHALYPEAALVWVLGEDQLARLPQWHQIERLTHLVSFLVVGRPGFPVVDVPPLPCLRVTRCVGHQIGLSSSEIRERAARGLPLEAYVPHKAVAYLREKRLYRTKS